MDIEEIKNDLLKNNIDPSVVDMVVDKLSKTIPEQVQNNIEEEIYKLRNEIDNEEDWRIKAKLAARIISLRIDS